MGPPAARLYAVDPVGLATIKASVWDAPASRSGQEAGLRRAVQRALVARLLALAADKDADAEVKKLGDDLKTAQASNLINAQNEFYFRNAGTLSADGGRAAG